MSAQRDGLRNRANRPDPSAHHRPATRL